MPRWLKPTLAVFCLVSGGVVWRVYSREPEPSLPVEPRDLRGAEQKADIRQLVRDNKWAEARQRIVAFQSQYPDVDTELMQTLLAAAEREVPVQRALEEAGRALEAGRTNEARELLAAVRPDTVQYKRLNALRSALALKSPSSADAGSGN